MSNYKLEVGDDETAVNDQILAMRKKIHTALPARIVDFNPSEQTATIEILILKVMQDGTSENYPPLFDVPVSFQRGGGFIATVPLKAGDEGIAIFNERCIDGWWATGKPSIPLDYRLQDLSDAIFIPGATSKPRAIKTFFTDGLSLQTESASTFIRLTEGKILIKGDIEHQGNTKQDGGQVSSKDIVAGSISLQNHTHSGVKSGDSNTGGPQ